MFQINLPSLTGKDKSVDLFTPVIDMSLFDPTLATIWHQHNPYNEAVLDHWAEGFADRDGKFVREFQTTFHPCFWELYVHAYLKDLGCRIDFSHHSPDFVVTAPVPFLVEATVALHGQQKPSIAEASIDNIPTCLNEFNRQAIIRLASSVISKKRKYSDSYKNLSHVAGKPFVLALAPFDRPYSWIQGHRAIEALLFQYYVDEEDWMKAGDTNAPLLGRELSEVRKDTGSPIPLGIFNDASHSEISAVLFNALATWGKVRSLSLDPNPCIVFQAGYHNPAGGLPEVVTVPKKEYVETLADGMNVYHNPNASHPLDPAVFRRPGVHQAYFNHRRGEWEHETNGRRLLFRRLTTGIGRS